MLIKFNYYETKINKIQVNKRQIVLKKGKRTENFKTAIKWKKKHCDKTESLSCDGFNRRSETRL